MSILKRNLTSNYGTVKLEGIEPTVRTILSADLSPRINWDKNNGIVLNIQQKIIDIYNQAGSVKRRIS